MDNNFNQENNNSPNEKHLQNSIELSLLDCGEKKRFSSFEIESSGQSIYTLIIFTEGDCTLVSEHNKFHLTKEDSFLCYPRRKIRISRTSQEQCSCIFFKFSGTKTTILIENAGYSSAKPIRHLHDITIYNSILNKMPSMDTTTFYNMMRRDAYLNSVIAELIKDYKTYAPQASTYDYQTSVYVKYTANYLKDNYCKSIKIGQIAEFIGISRNYLSMCFKDEMGLSPHEFLTKLRIDRAAELLETTLHPIQTISNSVGFDDAYVFSRAFKKKKGMSPKEYRTQSNSL